MSNYKLVSMRPSFMFAQSSGIVGLTLFSCFLKARKGNRISVNNTLY